MPKKIVGLLGENKNFFSFATTTYDDQICVLENMKYGRTIDFGVSMNSDAAPSLVVR